MTVSPCLTPAKSTRRTRYFPAVCLLRKHHRLISLQEHFEKLKAAYPGKKLLIVSNTAGATSFDKKLVLASELEQSTGLPVLPHASKKPGCGSEIMDYFRQHPETGVSHPSQIAIVGDRLSTDMMMANMMGAWGFWVKDGVVPPEQKSIVSDVTLPDQL